MDNVTLQSIPFLGQLSLVMMLLIDIVHIPVVKVLEEERVNLQIPSHPAQLGGVFASKAKRFADNHNHLWEQPTRFHAVVLVIWALGHTAAVHLAVAWTYCGLGLAHSIVQVTINHVWVRFSLFFYELECTRCYAVSRNYHCRDSGLKRLKRESNV